MRLTFPRFFFRLRKKYSSFQQKRLLMAYRHRVFTRFQANNFFCTTRLDNENQPSYYKLSAGLLADYRAKKKKKKSYMLGFELGYQFCETLKSRNIADVNLFLKGHGAQKKGFFQALLRQDLEISQLIDTTPIAHNGTRSVQRRRL